MSSLTGSISRRSLGKKLSYEGAFEGGKTGNFPLYRKRDAVPSLRCGYCITPFSQIHMCSKTK